MNTVNRRRRFGGTLAGVALAASLIAVPTTAAQASDAWVSTAQFFASAIGCDNSGRAYVNGPGPGNGLTYDAWRCSKYGDAWALWLHMTDA